MQLLEVFLTGIDFFDNIEIRFIVGVLNAATTPWNRTQLARWQSSTHTERKLINQRLLVLSSKYIW